MRRNLLEAVCRIAREAGEIVMPWFYAADLETRRKADRSQVTVADEAAEHAILDRLAALTPDIPVVAEESVAAGCVPDVGDDPFWLVDPLDGTREFIRKIPEFTVNIALIEQRRPVLGAVYLPASDELYAGQEGGGAFLEDGCGRRIIRTRRFPVSGITVAVSRTYGAGVDLNRFLARYDVAEQIDAGSSLKFCLVARGAADVYPRYGGSNEWDTAAGHAVLAAAGGSVCEINDGPELLYGKTGFSNPWFIAWGRP
ncbi:MAG: 3'(2'),5'-bisphosphate nucleotidase CysQ [Alphaproteobacteria bacterium]|nr:3'(2'),5'-bisphosphate nucleotidase CysQ [Alphaproteobacteria bacterium]MCY4231760.1 3'(2'),5'-bisphosphate nucleotidase CysQ [Alphaproteobacteria bacterium]MCY4317864.1 3'(2'),5'-bisphosphate nucleotidase CysQ [Alphaproteobacteria bacterium]